MSGPEAKLEQACRRLATAAGFLFYKFSSPAQRGVPDRVLIANGRTIFVELKAPGGQLTKLQEHHIKLIRERGVAALVIRSIDEFKETLNVIRINPDALLAEQPAPVPDARSEPLEGREHPVHRSARKR